MSSLILKPVSVAALRLYHPDMQTAMWCEESSRRFSSLAQCHSLFIATKLDMEYLPLMTILPADFWLLKKSLLAQHLLKQEPLGGRVKSPNIGL